MKVNVSKTIQERIKQRLEITPHLRNSDSKLICTLWWHDLLALGHEPLKLSALQFMEMLAENKLTNSESIRRGRQKVQEENPHLRGSSYSLRQKNQETIQTQLGYEYTKRS